MNHVTSRHLKLAERVLSGIEGPDERTAKELLAFITREVLNLQGTMSILSPAVLKLIDEHIRNNGGAE